MNSCPMANNCHKAWIVSQFTHPFFFTFSAWISPLFEGVYSPILRLYLSNFVVFQTLCFTTRYRADIHFHQPCCRSPFASPWAPGQAFRIWNLLHTYTPSSQERGISQATLTYLQRMYKIGLTPSPQAWSNTRGDFLFTLFNNPQPSLFQVLLCTLGFPALRPDVSSFFSTLLRRCTSLCKTVGK